LATASLLLFEFERDWQSKVARTSPGEFIRQVRAEKAKVVWPSGRETVMTTIMVMIMTTVLGVFFFALDSGFAGIVKALLSLID
jgi:preprotein translocase subunit SecE